MATHRRLIAHYQFMVECEAICRQFVRLMAECYDRGERAQLAVDTDKILRRIIKKYDDEDIKHMQRTRVKDPDEPPKGA